LKKSKDFGALISNFLHTQCNCKYYFLCFFKKKEMGCGATPCGFNIFALNLLKEGIPKGRSVPDGTRFEREAGRNPFGQGFGGGQPPRS
jgi:hypothetical protein